MYIFFWIFIQTVAEVLPISSSGHIFLFQKIWSYYDCVTPSDLPLETIDFLLHIPTFIILLIFFFKDWWKMILKKPIAFSVFFERDSWIKIARVLLFLGTSSLITTLFWWKRYYEYLAVPLPVGFLFTATAIFSLQLFPEGRGCLWWIRDAVILGFVQGSMMNVGFSRLAFTLLAGRFLGYNPRTAFAISFLIEIPLLFGAGMKGLFDIYQKPEIFTEYFAINGVFVMLVAAILSYFILQLVDSMIKKGKLHYISGYMIIPFIISLVFERCL